MRTLNLTPLYRNAIGFDRLANLLDATYQAEQGNIGYPPYDVEALNEHQFFISLAVAGFAEDELEFKVEQGVLTVTGKKEVEKTKHKLLYQGIAARTFERKFDLAEHVEITGANLNNGLLVIDLKQEIPETLKPKRILIKTEPGILVHQTESGEAA